MEKNKTLFFLLLILSVIFESCRQDTTEQDPFVPLFSTYNDTTASPDTPVVRKEINYGLLTPVEICNIFERLGVTYYDSILNPVHNSDLYLSSSKVSINTGIYGVDFGYLRMFGLSQEMINYMVTIRELSHKLGIPDRLMLEPIKSIGKELADPDTVLGIMNKAYTEIDAELREDGRESTAGLMIMGGWVEAMYIATQVVYDPDNPDPEVVANIAEQKFALASLLSFMKNYYDDPVVVYYTKKLKYLQRYFDSFEIYFKKGDLEIDPVQQVLRSSGSEMNITVETLNNIRDYIGRLRSEMVTP